MLSKAPSHLVLHRKLFYFRRRVPNDLRQRIGKTEIRLSLGTGYVDKARAAAARLTAATDSIFTFLRHEPENMELTDDQIKQLVEEWVQRELEQVEQERLARTKPIAPSQLSHSLLVNEEMREIARSGLALCDYSRIGDTIAKIIASNGLNVVHGSLAYNKLCREFLVAVDKFFSIEGRRLTGDYTDHEIPAIVVSAPPHSAPATPSKPLPEAIDLFIKDKVASEEWKPQSVKESRKLYLFSEILGDPPCNTLNADHMRQYKEAMFKLPANMRKLKRYRDLPLADILTMHIPDKDKMKIDTIRNHFEKARTFLSWAKLNGFIPDSEIKGILKAKSDKQPHENRAPFSADDIAKLFAKETFLFKRAAQPYKFWVPLIGLFSGMRIEEICQLYLDDIREEDGVLCFWVTDERPDQHLKNKASKRYVPMHPFLRDVLNLPDYVKWLRRQGKRRLFPELNKKDDNASYSKNASRWFNDYRRDKVKVLGDEKGRKDFHSFRTNIGQWCDNRGLPEKLAGRILGHKHQGITYGRYSTDTAPSRMYNEVFSKLDYGVDLSHLQESKYVVK